MIRPLPVLVILALTSFVVVLAALRRRRALTLPRAVVAGAASVYGAGIVANTVFPIYLGDRVTVPQVWTVYLNLVPFHGTEPRDMVTNVVVFVPLGVLVPLLTRFRSVAAVTAIGFALSLAMESVQLVNAVTGHGGHVADVNDLGANTVGAPLGFGLYLLAVRVPMLARLAERASWRRATAT